MLYAFIQQSAMPPSAIPTATATFGLLRTLGGAIGVSVGGTIYGSELRKRLPAIQGFDSSFLQEGGASSALSYPISALKEISPPELRQQVLQAYALSIQRIWMVACPMAGVAFLLTFVIKVYTLNRASTRLPAGAKPTPVKGGQTSPPKDDTAVPSSADADVEKVAEDKTLQR